MNKLYLELYCHIQLLKFEKSMSFYQHLAFLALLDDSSGLNVPPVAETNVPGIAETNVPAVAE